MGDKINAGIYVCSSSVLRRIELKPTSIEREVKTFFSAVLAFLGPVCVLFDVLKPTSIEREVGTFGFDFFQLHSTYFLLHASKCTACCFCFIIQLLHHHPFCSYSFA